MEDKELQRLIKFYHLWWQCLKQNEIYKKVCKNGHFAFEDERDDRLGAKFVRGNLFKTYGIFGDVFSQSFEDWVQGYFEKYIKPGAEKSARWFSPNNIKDKHNFYAMGFEKGHEASEIDYKRIMDALKPDLNERSYEKEATVELYNSGLTSVEIDLTQSNERIFEELSPLLKELRSKVNMDILKPEIFRRKGFPNTKNFDIDKGFHRLKVLDTYMDVSDEGGYRHIWGEVVKRIGADDEKISYKLTKPDAHLSEMSLDMPDKKKLRDWAAIERTYLNDKQKAEEMILSAVTLSFPFGGEGLMKRFS